MSNTKSLKDMTDDELYEVFSKKYESLSKVDEKDLDDPVVVEFASRVARGRD